MSENKEQKELSLVATIEALLFYFAEPITLKKLASLTKWDVAAVRGALADLDARLRERESGVVVIVHNDEASLGTAPGASALIESLAKEELSKELSRAALETLSIVCYKGPLTRADIDYVRGVNSTFILRNLQMRGIVEKLDNPADARASLYAPTMQALQYMGVSRREDLPRFSEVQEQLAGFINARQDEDAVKVTEAPLMIDDSSEEKATLCDTDGDGVLTEEECVAPSEHTAEHGGEEELSRDADIAEEGLMGSEYIDESVTSHEKRDEEAID